MRNAPDKTESGRYIAITPALLAAAEVIKQTFLSTRAAYVPTAKGAGKSDVFLKAAIFCRKLGEEPGEFAARMVKRAFEKGFPVFPNILLSKGLAIDKAPKIERPNTGTRYLVQLTKFRRMLTSFTPAQMLGDPTLDFTPLFRYAMGAMHHLTNVLDFNRDGARLELLTYPEARKVFGELLETL